MRREYGGLGLWEVSDRLAELRWNLWIDGQKEGSKNMKKYLEGLWQCQLGENREVSW